MSADENKRMVALGGLLLRIGNFNGHNYEKNFDSRLVLQKTVYLMQQFGLNIGYSFSWYLRGPYSPNLTRDAYELTKSNYEIPVKFADRNKEQRFCEFLEFINPISNNSYYLEKLAVTHFLYTMYPTLSKGEIYSKVRKKIPSVSLNDFNQMLKLLRSHNLIGETQY